MRETGLRSVVESRRLNATIGWILVVALVAVGGAQFVGGQSEWAAFAVVVAAIAVVPAVAFRDSTAMVPWEVLFIAALPLFGRLLVVGETVGEMTFTGRVTTYIAVAAVALILAVELDVFTPVRMNYTFAQVFVVITTMAAAGVWAVLRWLSDVLIGTSFLYDGRPESVIEEMLMWDFVAATVAGVVAGLVFEYYFRRRARLEARLPERESTNRPEEVAP
jgi:hypothetical protein